MEVDTLAETVGSLRIRNTKESSTPNDEHGPKFFNGNNKDSRRHPSFGLVNEDASGTGDQKEYNARDYFDDTSVSMNLRKHSASSDTHIAQKNDTGKLQKDPKVEIEGPSTLNKDTNDFDSKEEKSDIPNHANSVPKERRTFQKEAYTDEPHIYKDAHEIQPHESVPAKLKSSYSNRLPNIISTNLDTIPTEKTNFPFKSRFVKSNGSPYGSREYIDRSLVNPSPSFVDRSTGDDDYVNTTGTKTDTAAPESNKPESIHSLSDSSYNGPGSNRRNSLFNSRSVISPAPVHTSSPRSSSSSSPRSLSRHSSRTESLNKLHAASPRKHDPYDDQDDDEDDLHFDKVNEILSKGRVPSGASSRAASQALPHSKDEGPSAFLSFNGDTIVGFRAKESEKRRLESENLELRMKLQQYREMNTGENEMAKMKHELSRAEKRIDDLELALERKNKVIEDLTSDRDHAIESLKQAEAFRVEEQARADGMYAIIEELQAVVSDLESDKKFLDQAHAEFPDIIPDNPTLRHLLNALSNTVEQNNTLTRVSALASSLKAQNAQIMSAVHGTGRKGDPAQVIREISGEVASLRRREQELLKMLDQTEFSRHEMEAVISRLEDTSREAKSHSYALIQNFFAELFDVLGNDFQDKVEAELKEIVDKSLRDSVSKIPPLSDLMVSYTRAIAEMAQNSRDTADRDQRVAMLETQNQSLEHFIELKMDKLQADNVLRAQIKDLQREVKRLNELRQSEWKEYQRVVKNAH